MNISASLALVAGLLAAPLVPANAQSANNCSALSGTPLMCLENRSSFPIVGVQAASSMSFGADWIAIPGGMIQPGGMAIVRFPTRGSDCNKFVVVKTMANTTHVFPNVNVCNSTKFAIGGW